MIASRGDFGVPFTNFSRSWEDYRIGFGSLTAEFWFGNEFIHRLTSFSDSPMALRVELEDFEGLRAYAEYSMFRSMIYEACYQLYNDIFDE